LVKVKIKFSTTAGIGDTKETPRLYLTPLFRRTYA
jgi:hypothetical protein